VTRLSEHRPDHGHNESKVPLNIADFDAISPVVDNTPGAVKRAASRLVRRSVDDRDGQQEVLRALYGQQPRRRPAGTLEQAYAEKRGKPVAGRP
jgi:hypothetical protein